MAQILKNSLRCGCICRKCKNVVSVCISCRNTFCSDAIRKIQAEQDEVSEKLEMVRSEFSGCQQTGCCSSRNFAEKNDIAQLARLRIFKLQNKRDSVRESVLRKRELIASLRYD